MAKKKKFKKSKKTAPKMGVYFSHKKGKKYINGPSFGLWDSDSDKVMARGTLKDERLDDLIEYLKKRQKREESVNVALLKNKKRKDRDEDEDDDSDSDDEDSDEDDDSDSDDEDSDDDDDD